MQRSQFIGCLFCLVILVGCQRDSRREAGDELLPVGSALPSLDANVWWRGQEAASAPDVAGKIVVLEAFASWCGDCRREMPARVKLTTEQTANDVIFLGLTSETMADSDAIRQFLADYQVPWVIGVGAAATLETLRVQEIPWTAVYGRDGKLIWHSYLPDSPITDLRAALEAARRAPSDAA